MFSIGFKYSGLEAADEIDGVTAWRLGFALADNPHPECSLRFEAWEHGWLAASGPGWNYFESAVICPTA